jgi:hypothetical protein
VAYLNSSCECGRLTFWIKNCEIHRMSPSSIAC